MIIIWILLIIILIALACGVTFFFYRKSKYWKKQVEQKDKLEEIKNKGELEKYISNLPKWEELKEVNYNVEDAKQFILTKNNPLFNLFENIIII